MDIREYQNNFQKYNDQIMLSDSGLELTISLKDKFNNKIISLLDQLESNIDNDYNNCSIYTGVAGVAFLYYQLSICYPNQKEKYLNKSKIYLERCLSKLKGKVFSFHCGDSGILSISAIIFNSIGLRSQFEECIQRLIGGYKDIIQSDDIPDEVLYGRSGYLLSILFVNRYLKDAIDDEVIIKVANKILESGRQLAYKEKCKCPLMYEWHEKKYLGAAHGLAGILYFLLKCSFIETLRPDIKNYVQPTIDYILTLQYKSGNFPSSLNSKSDDKLVHWCHGAPGWIYTLISAYQIFGDKKYLMAAERCVSVIWERGLLKKGYGICHGVAGNGYAFLAMFNLTNDQKYLYMAVKFGEWCCDYGKHGCRLADRPYSLYEGMAGTIYFLCDLIHPTLAKFPAYEI